MANQPPVISVVLPVYNAESHVGSAIESILSQTFTDFELLIVDDGSTDGTPHVLSGFDDPRIKLLNNGRNVGLVASLNRGISEAKGDLIARMDADDISMSHRFELQVAAFQADPALGVVSSHYLRFLDDPDVTELVALPETDEDIRRDIYCKANCFCHPSSMIRKECFHRVGLYKPEWFPVEDRELWLRILSDYKGANMSQPLLKYRQSQLSISGRNFRVQDTLNIESSAQALEHPMITIDAPDHKIRESIVRGLMYVALGRASQDRVADMHAYFERAVLLDQDVANSCFQELLIDRLAAYMFHSDYDVNGGHHLLTTVFTALPKQIRPSSSLQPWLRSEVHAISAFHFAQLGQITLARRAAVRSLTSNRQHWRNRGLIKLATRLNRGQG